MAAKRDTEGCSLILTSDGNQTTRQTTNSLNSRHRPCSCWNHPVCVEGRCFILKNLLPISLITAAIFGALVPQPGAAISHPATLYICIIGMSFYTGLYLTTDAILEALKSYRSYIWGLLSILFVSVIVGIKLSALMPFAPLEQSIVDPVQASNYSHTTNSTISLPELGYRDSFVVGPFEFGIALQVFFSVPSTISGGVIMVCALEGNYALAVLLTAVSNIAGIFTVPLLLPWLAHVGETKITFDILSMLMKLSLSFLLPLTLAKFLQFFEVVRKFSAKWKTYFKITSILLLATLIWTKISTASASGKLSEVSAVSLLIVIGFSAAVHTTYLLMNGIAGAVLCLPVDHIKCLVILCSQKTVSIAVAITSFLPESFGDHGLMVIPMVLAFLTIATMDSIIVASWLHVEGRKNSHDGKKKDVTLSDDALKNIKNTEAV